MNGYVDIIFHTFSMTGSRKSCFNSVHAHLTLLSAITRADDIARGGNRHGCKQDLFLQIL